MAKPLERQCSKSMIPDSEPPSQGTHGTTIKVSDRANKEPGQKGGSFTRMPYADAIIGREIHNIGGGKVIEHTTPAGVTVALKVKTRETLRFSEADLMHYAATHGILAPKVYGVYDIESSPRARVMVSDRVPGAPLVEVWQSASQEDKDSYKAQLREQLKRMRECTQPFIGRVTKSGEPQPTHNVFDRLFGNDLGPFQSEEEFDGWCLARVLMKTGHISRRKWKRFIEQERRNASSGKFVLTHGNLSPGNIIVKDGVITGIIDWGRGGFFPEYAEYAFAMELSPGIEEWWIPVLQEILQSCSKDRLKFTRLVEHNCLEPLRLGCPIL